MKRAVIALTVLLMATPAWAAEPHPTAQISHPAAPTRWLGSAIFSFGGRGRGQFTHPDYVPRVWVGARDGDRRRRGVDRFFSDLRQSTSSERCPGRLCHRSRMGPVS